MKPNQANTASLREALTTAGQTSLLHGWVLFVFLRHPGCIFTSTTLTALGQQRKEIESLGVQIVIVHLDPELDCARQQSEKFGLAGVQMISDTERKLYRAVGLGQGNVWQTMNPSVLWTGLKAFLGGHRQTSIKADPRQLAGMAILSDGELRLNESCADVAEVPDFLGRLRKVHF